MSGSAPGGPGARLAALGWAPFFADAFAALASGERGPDPLEPARVSAVHRTLLEVIAKRGELSARIAGAIRHRAQSVDDLPVVGDWVAIAARPGEDVATIRAVLPRRSHFSRKAAGDANEEQVLAANVDVAFLVTSLDRDLNARRLERYLTMVWESGAEPVVVLSKADLRDDVDGSLAELQGELVGAEVIAVSGVTGAGVDAVAQRLRGGADAAPRTGAFFGSSGVGKSTLINRLAGLSGERALRVADVRADGKGRHTTTHRQLIVLPSGGLVIDTPGMRELQLWEADEGIAETFGEIEALAAECRFGDCAHESEPGCAVRAAVESGTLGADRLASYHKLRKEVRYLETKQDKRARAEENKKHRSIHKGMRHNKKGT